MNVHTAVQTHLDNAAQIKSLQAANKALAQAILTHMDEENVQFVEGTSDDHGLKRVETVRWTMNTAKAKAELGEDWVIANSKQALVVSLRLSRED